VLKRDVKACIVPVGKPEWKSLLGRPLCRSKIELQLIITFLNATLHAYAAMFKWYKAPVIVLSSVYIFFGVYQ
jgi:hypothetical protein